MTARTFFWRAVLIGAMVAGTVGAIALAPGMRSTYVDAVLDKQGRLDSLPPGKLVLVGGSNLAFGVDTPTLSAALHRPGVNMGLYGEISLAFELQQVKPAIARGDLIVISPEYENLFERPESLTILCGVISDIPRPWRFVSWTECARCMIVTAVHRFQSNAEIFMRRLFRLRQREEANDIYMRESFDEYGDMRRHLDRPSTFVASSLPLRSTLKKIDEKSLRALADLAETARKRGATAVFVYPVEVAEGYAIDRAGIEQLERRLRLQPPMPVLGTPQDFVLPIDQFFDTKYHTNARGRASRTEKLEKLLAPYSR